jgi:hypothetical protein
VVRELRRQLARRRQRQGERAREVAHRLASTAPDLREYGDVPPAERRVALDELPQLGRRTAA